MKKKITSFINFKNEYGKLKIGTTDKKRMNVIFFEGGLYISPKTKRDNYSDIILQMKKELSKEVKEKVKNSLMFQNDCMVFTDIADERIAYNKPSLLSYQIYVKPTTDTLSRTTIFKDLVADIVNKENNIYNINDIIESFDFIIKKK